MAETPAGAVTAGEIAAMLRERDALAALDELLQSAAILEQERNEADQQIATLRAERDRLMRHAETDAKTLDALIQERNAAEQRVKELTALLTRLLEWDHLEGSADGPYWKRTITAAIASQGTPVVD